MIPASCTSLLQPIDVGINKPFKDRLRTVFGEWLEAQDLEHENIPSPTRVVCVEWIRNCWHSMPDQIVRNAWMKTGFNYFVQGNGNGEE